MAGNSSRAVTGDRMKGAACIYCKCTNAKVCAGGCWWISEDPPVCSSTSCDKKFRESKTDGQGSLL